MSEERPYREMGERFQKWALNKFGLKAEAARRFGKAQSDLERYFQGAFPLSFKMQQQMLDLGASLDEVVYVVFGKMGKEAEKGRARPEGTLVIHAPKGLSATEREKWERLVKLLTRAAEDDPHDIDRLNQILDLFFKKPHHG